MYQFNKEYLIKAENKVEAFELFYNNYIDDIPEKFINYIDWKKMLRGWEECSGLKIKKVKGQKAYKVMIED